MFQIGYRFESFECFLNRALLARTPYSATSLRSVFRSLMANILISIEKPVWRNDSLFDLEKQTCQHHQPSFDV